MAWSSYWPYLAVMAVTTYLIRMAPFVLFRNKIKSRFIRSFLCYVPYAVLAAMTLPGILYSTGSMAAAAVGLIAALALSLKEKPLLTVAVAAAAAAFVAEWALGGLL